MTGETIEVTVDDEAVISVLGKLLDRLEDPSPALAEIGEYGIMSTRARIEDQNYVNPLWPWEALTPGYRESSLKKEHHPDEILILYGDLVGSFVWQAGPDQVGWGTNREYAAAQHFGREEINLPARPYVGLSDQDSDKVLAIMATWLSGALP